jgi:RHS repeat-associated protein
MKYKLTLALVASLTSTAFAAFQAPLPEFKNEKQLAEWRAEKAAEATSQGYAAEDTAFYTGRPYIASTGSYAFKYRSYSPEVARWTSDDPSGFPDGANNLIYVSNQCLSYCDPNGLSQVLVTFSNYALVISNNYTWAQWMMNFPNPAAMLFGETAAYDTFKASISSTYSIGDDRVVGPHMNDMSHYYPDGVKLYKSTKSIQDIIFETIDGEGDVRRVFKATVVSTQTNYYE